MRRLAHLSLAVLGAALAVPTSARAQADAPVSRSEATSPRKHLHLGHPKAEPNHECARCAAARVAKAKAGAIPAAPMVMPDGTRIVGCAHSTNGVCATCVKLLAMPGVMTAGAPGTPAPGTAVATAAPGRAVASDAAPGRAMVADAAEPEPIGVMRTTFSPAGTPAAPGMPARPAAPMAQPARSPFLSDAPAPRPHILAHLFGVAAIDRDAREVLGTRDRRKKEAHAATAYGDPTSKVDELPASMVYGRRDR